MQKIKEKKKLNIVYFNKFNNETLAEIKSIFSYNTRSLKFKKIFST